MISIVSVEMRCECRNDQYSKCSEVFKILKIDQMINTQNAQRFSNHTQSVLRGFQIIAQRFSNQFAQRFSNDQYSICSECRNAQRFSNHTQFASASCPYLKCSIDENANGNIILGGVLFIGVLFMKSMEIFHIKGNFM
jgi:hypothetical protein